MAKFFECDSGLLNVESVECFKISSRKREETELWFVVALSNSGKEYCVSGPYKTHSEAYDGMFDFVEKIEKRK